jgi:hypothetical protein
MTDPITTLTGGLIVSCQAYPGEPLRHPETMAQMAEAVVAGGAVAIRAQGLADISFIKGRTTVPLIGLWKDGHDGVFITPPFATPAPSETPEPKSSPSTAPAAPDPTASPSPTPSRASGTADRP